MYKVRKKDAQGIPLEQEKMNVVLLNRNPRKRVKSARKHVPLLDRSVHFMKEIVVTQERVTKLLKGLKPSKALGLDDLHPRVLTELTRELGPVIAHLFQQSVDSGEIHN